MTQPRPDPREFERRRAEPAVEAFETLVRAHYGRLCAFAFRLVGSRETAEDVVHDVLLRIWRDRDRFDFRDPLAYLYRSVRNQVINDRRRHGRRARLLAELSVEGRARPHGAPDAAAAVESHDLARAAAAAVDALPERCRLVYTMRREQGLSYAEIAGVLGVSLKTVENQMTRAAKLLHARLAGYLSLVAVVASDVI